METVLQQIFGFLVQVIKQETVLFMRGPNIIVQSRSEISSPQYVINTAEYLCKYNFPTRALIFGLIFQISFTTYLVFHFLII